MGSSSSSATSSSLQLNGFTLPEEGPAEVVERDVAKLVRLDNAVMGVPAQFQLCHVVAAAFVGLAMGTDQQNLKLKSLESPECTIKLGSGIYDFKDPHRAFYSAQTVSLFSLDLAPRSFDTRLSVAGISFALYGKRAVAKMAVGGGGSDPDAIRQFLRNADAKKRLAAIFRRVYRRLVQPIDEFSSDAHQHRPLRTRESDLLHSTLANLLAVSNVSSEESLDCFHVTLHVCMQFIDRLVRSLVDE